tara:strand:+ start:53 stop:247 length:195 start_codon:yes stop_codon:yes gene_type:complete
MNKKEMNKLLKDKKIKNLVNKFKKEVKRNNKVINDQQKQFIKMIEKLQKNHAKFEEQLKQFKRL